MTDRGHTDENSIGLAADVDPELTATAIRNCDRVRTVHTVVRGIDTTRIECGTQYVPFAYQQ